MGLKWDVLRLAFELHVKEDRPFGEDLFERVGRALNISGPAANKMFYDPANRDDREHAKALYGG